MVVDACWLVVDAARDIILFVSLCENRTSLRLIIHERIYLSLILRMSTDKSWTVLPLFHAN